MQVKGLNSAPLLLLPGGLHRLLLRGNLFHIRHHLTDKRVVVQLLGVNDLSVHNPSFGKRLSDCRRVNVREVVPFLVLIERGKLLIGQRNKLVKAHACQPVSDQVIQGHIFLAAYELAVNKGVYLKLRQINRHLDFVLVVLGGGVGNAHIGQVRVVSALVLPVFLTAESINKILCSLQRRNELLRGESLGQRVEIPNEALGNGFPVLVLIQNNAHRSAIIVFLSDVLQKLLRVGVFNALTDFSVAAKVVDASHRLGFGGSVLVQGNDIDRLLTVLVNRDIVATVVEQVRVDCQPMGGYAAHRHSLAVQCFGGQGQLQCLAHQLGVLTVHLKEVAHLIEVDRLGAVRLCLWFFHLFRLILHLQVVVHGVLRYHAVKVLSGFFPLEQRERHIIEHDPLVVKGEDFKLLCAEINSIPKVVFIVGRGVRLRLLFGWCCGKDFLILSALSSFTAALFLLFKPCRV